MTRKNSLRRHSKKEESPIVSLHVDKIVKQGVLKQKPSILKKWKSRSFLFDGHVLYKLKSTRQHEEEEQILTFIYRDKYVIIKDKDAESQEAPVITKVVDAQGLVGKPFTIGFFFENSSGDSASHQPLFLMAENAAEHEQWLSVLQKAVLRCDQSSYDTSGIHQAVEAMVDMAVISDAFGVIQCVNNSLLQFFGYLRSELIHKNVKELMPIESARIHDQYMDRYRKTGDQRLIGVSRVLQVKLRNGTIAYAMLSLGEIPDSTNSDRDRFLAVMKPVKAKQQVMERNSQKGSRYNTAIMQSILHNMNEKMSLSLSEFETAIHEQINSQFTDISNQCTQIEQQIEELELKNANLLRVTTDQQGAIEYLKSSISRAYHQNVQRHELTHSTMQHSLSAPQLRSAASSSKYLKAMEGASKSSRAISKTLSNIHQIIEQQHVDFDQIMKVDIALRYFMIYAATEQATDNFKFYIYLTKHYKTETNLDMLATKRDFIMDTFIRSGSLYELNISSRTRIIIEEQYKQLQLLSEEENTDSSEELRREEVNSKVLKEQRFFDSVLSAIKAVMFDTYSRFRSHSLYHEMKEELCEASISELEMLHSVTADQN